MLDLLTVSQAFSCWVPAEDTRGTVLEKKKKLSVVNQAVPFRFLLKTDATKAWWLSTDYR